MTATTEKAVNKVVRDRWPIPRKWNRLIAIANFDLYYGPVGDTQDDDHFRWPGWCKAIDLLKGRFEDVSDLWVDTESESWSDKEPDSGYFDEHDEWQEYYMEGWVHLERRDVLRVLLGKELSTYI